MRAFRDLSVGLTTQPRGIGEEKEPALNQLQMKDVQRNKALIGGVAVKDAIDALYENVPTIRRKLTIRPDSVALFGSRGAPVRPVCLTFDKESAGLLVEEREGIQTTLEGLTDADPRSFEWRKRSLPHLALGKVSTNVGGEKVDALIGGLEEICLPELVLCRATLHNPYENT